MPTIEVYTTTSKEAKVRLVDALIECRAQLLDTYIQEGSSYGEGRVPLSVLVKVQGSKIDDFVRIAKAEWALPPVFEQGQEVGDG